MFGSGKVKVKLQFRDTGESRNLNFQANYFLPTKGDRIHVDSGEELYVVRDKITHFGDDEIDYTLVLEEDAKFKGDIALEKELIAEIEEE